MCLWMMYLNSPQCLATSSAPGRHGRPPITRYHGIRVYGLHPWFRLSYFSIYSFLCRDRGGEQIPLLDKSQRHGSRHQELLLFDFRQIWAWSLATQQPNRFPIWWSHLPSRQSPAPGQDICLKQVVSSITRNGARESQSKLGASYWLSPKYIKS